MKKLICCLLLLMLSSENVLAESLEDLLLRKGVVTSAELSAIRKPGQPVSPDALRDLLVKKGVISSTDAASVAAAPAPAASGAKISWKGGTRFEMPEAGVNAALTLLLKERYTYTDADGGSDKSSFETKNARVYFSGDILKKEFSYMYMADFVGKTDDGLSSPTTKDAYLQWNPLPTADVRMGQYLVPVTRQVQTSPAKLQFPDASPATGVFAYGRNQGLMGGVKCEDNSMYARAAIFNGQSDGEGENMPGVDTDHLGVVTGRIDVLGPIDAFEESDVAYSKEPGLSFGASYAYGDSENSVTRDEVSIGDERTNQTIGVDATFKYLGFSALSEVFYRDYDSDLAGTAEPMGAYIQAGYFLIPEKVEVAGRWSYIDCDDGLYSAGVCRGSENVNEAAAVLAYYFWKNHMKAMVSFDTVNQDAAVADADDVTTNRWIFQMSGFF